MRRGRLRRAPALVVTAVVALCALAAAALATTHPALGLRATKVGKILVDSRGYTVYAFTTDHKNYDSCAKIRHCLAAWPVVRPSTPLAGSGVKRSLIGAITLKSGVKQLTYAGHPLYTYLGDSHPAETNFVNLFQFGGRWPALNASGREVK